MSELAHYIVRCRITQKFNELLNDTQVQIFNVSFLHTTMHNYLTSYFYLFCDFLYIVAFTQTFVALSGLLYANKKLLTHLLIHSCRGYKY